MQNNDLTRATPELFPEFAERLDARIVQGLHRHRHHLAALSKQKVDSHHTLSCLGIVLPIEKRSMTISSQALYYKVFDQHPLINSKVIQEHGSVELIFQVRTDTISQSCQKTCVRHVAFKPRTAHGKLKRHP
ncbi:MAG: hypothetical protein Q4E62_00545 [Sutterellaceae bacterium]|nr:hypothetical protein [Sutterellaceae bacterium]